MPLYEYYCGDCRSKFELLLSYADSGADLVCMKCRSSNVRKMFSVFAAPRRGDASPFGDYGEYGEYGDASEYGESDGGCGCGGGGCTCHD